MDSWSMHDTGLWEPFFFSSLAHAWGKQPNVCTSGEAEAWRALAPAAGVSLPPPVSPPKGLTGSACGCRGPWESLLSLSNITSGVSRSGHVYKRPPSLECHFRMWTDRALANESQWERLFQPFKLIKINVFCSTRELDVLYVKYPYAPSCLFLNSLT